MFDDEITLSNTILDWLFLENEVMHEISEITNHTSDEDLERIYNKYEVCKELDARYNPKG